MFKGFATFVARHAGKERPPAIRGLALLAGGFTFLVLAPIALGIAGHGISAAMAWQAPRSLERMLGTAGLGAGLFFLAWSVSTFWFAGKGTPWPAASPVRLVTTGPFRYTRNPIKLGAILYYFGLGALLDSVVTGLVMLLIAGLLGILYHRFVEEQELALRFGAEYEAYRRRTSFLLPLPPKRDLPPQP